MILPEPHFPIAIVLIGMGDGTFAAVARLIDDLDTFVTGEKLNYFGLFFVAVA